MWGTVTIAREYLQTNAISVDTVQTDEMFVGHRDVDEHLRQKLEGIHGLGIVGTVS